MSALVQSLAAILGLTVSSTFILVQIWGEKSPSSIRFFPNTLFKILIVVISIAIIFDSIVLFILPENLIYLNYIVVIRCFIIGMYGHFIILYFFIMYVFKVVRVLNPEYLINYLQEKIYPAVRNVNIISFSDSRKIIHTLEELTLGFISKRYSMYITESLSCIDFIYPEVIISNYKESRENIIFLITESIREIGFCLIKNDYNNKMDILGECIANLFLTLDILKLEEKTLNFVVEELTHKLDINSLNKNIFYNGIVNSIVSFEQNSKTIFNSIFKEAIDMIDTEMIITCLEQLLLIGKSFNIETDKSKIIDYCNYCKSNVLMDIQCNTTEELIIRKLQQELKDNCRRIVQSTTWD